MGSGDASVVPKKDGAMRLLVEALQSPERGSSSANAPPGQLNNIFGHQVLVQPNQLGSLGTPAAPSQALPNVSFAAAAGSALASPIAASMVGQPAQVPAGPLGRNFGGPAPTQHEPQQRRVIEFTDAWRPDAELDFFGADEHAQAVPVGSVPLGAPFTRLEDDEDGVSEGLAEEVHAEGEFDCSTDEDIRKRLMDTQISVSNADSLVIMSFKLPIRVVK